MINCLCDWYESFQREENVDPFIKSEGKIWPARYKEAWKVDTLDFVTTITLPRNQFRENAAKIIGKKFDNIHKLVKSSERERKLRIT